MIENKSEVLNRVHKIELNLALEVKRICEKYKIKYFLIAGTMLGAVRHQGFIPWDDDMDIGMLRSDYERFIKICKEELCKEYFLQTWDTDIEYPFSYAKLRVNGTRFVEKFSENSKAHQGIFIDIFPFDNSPINNVDKKIQGLKIYVLKRLLWIKKGYGKNLTINKKNKFKILYLKMIVKFFSFNYLKKTLNDCLIKHNDVATDYVFTDGSYGYKKETIKKEWVVNLSNITFENINFLAIENFEDYLIYFYGNYMELPPQEKRGGHEVIDICFGKYKMSERKNDFNI